jgi:hypothetical protein
MVVWYNHTGVHHISDWLYQNIGTARILTFWENNRFGKKCTLYSQTSKPSNHQYSCPITLTNFTSTKWHRFVSLSLSCWLMYPSFWRTCSSFWPTEISSHSWRTYRFVMFNLSLSNWWILVHLSIWQNSGWGYRTYLSFWRSNVFQCSCKQHIVSKQMANDLNVDVWSIVPGFITILKHPRLLLSTMRYNNAIELIDYEPIL